MIDKKDTSTQDKQQILPIYQELHRELAQILPLPNVQGFARALAASEMISLEFKLIDLKGAAKESLEDSLQRCQQYLDIALNPKNFHPYPDQVLFAKARLFEHEQTPNRKERMSKALESYKESLAALRQRGDRSFNNTLAQDRPPQVPLAWLPPDEYKRRQVTVLIEIIRVLSKELAKPAEAWQTVLEIENLRLREKVGSADSAHYYWYALELARTIGQPGRDLAQRIRLNLSRASEDLEYNYQSELKRILAEFDAYLKAGE